SGGSSRRYSESASSLQANTVPNPTVISHAASDTLHTQALVHSACSLGGSIGDDGTSRTTVSNVRGSLAFQLMNTDLAFSGEIFIVALLAQHIGHEAASRNRGLEISIRVVIHRAFWQPLPLRSEISSGEVLIELRELGCFLFKVTAELRVGV